MQTQLGRNYEDYLIQRITQRIFQSDYFGDSESIARCNLGEQLCLTFTERDMYRFVDYIKQEGYGCQ